MPWVVNVVPGPPQSSRAHLAVPGAGLMNLPMKRHLVCVSGLRVWSARLGYLCGKLVCDKRFGWPGGVDSMDRGLAGGHFPVYSAFQQYSTV